MRELLTRPTRRLPNGHHSPALAPWITYLRQLHPADRAVMLADMTKLGMGWGAVLATIVNHGGR